MKGLRACRGECLLELDEVERRLKPLGAGTWASARSRSTRLWRTDGRASSFTHDFRPLHAFSRERLCSLVDAFAGGGFPPIVAVKLGEMYFVIDGHHRAGPGAPRTHLLCPKPGGARLRPMSELEKVFVGGTDLVEGSERELVRDRAVYEPSRLRALGTLAELTRGCGRE
jgi:hypothetical protein